jgi:hypothetical protein
MVPRNLTGWRAYNAPAGALLQLTYACTGEVKCVHAGDALYGQLIESDNIANVGIIAGIWTFTDDAGHKHYSSAPFMGRSVLGPNAVSVWVTIPYGGVLGGILPDKLYPCGVDNAPFTLMVVNLMREDCNFIQRAASRSDEVMDGIASPALKATTTLANADPVEDLLSHVPTPGNLIATLLIPAAIALAVYVVVMRKGTRILG